MEAVIMEFTRHLMDSVHYLINERSPRQEPRRGRPGGLVSC
jgi:hypothetical protein